MHASGEGEPEHKSRQFSPMDVQMLKQEKLQCRRNPDADPNPQSVQTNPKSQENPCSFNILNLQVLLKTSERPKLKSRALNPKP